MMLPQLEIETLNPCVAFRKMRCFPWACKKQAKAVATGNVNANCQTNKTTRHVNWNGNANREHRVSVARRRRGWVSVSNFLALVASGVTWKGHVTPYAHIKCSHNLSNRINLNRVWASLASALQSFGAAAAAADFGMGSSKSQKANLHLKGKGPTMCCWCWRSHRHWSRLAKHAKYLKQYFQFNKPR